MVLVRNKIRCARNYGFECLFENSWQCPVSVKYPDRPIAGGGFLRILYIDEITGLRARAANVSLLLLFKANEIRDTRIEDISW